MKRIIVGMLLLALAALLLVGCTIPAEPAAEEPEPVVEEPEPVVEEPEPVVEEPEPVVEEPTPPKPVPSPTLMLLDLNVSYISQSGLMVIVKSITETQQGGFREYTITYSLENNTTDQAIDEGTFKMFWVGGGGEAQYGFFGRLFPGESMTRSYTWKVLSSQQVLCIEFESDFFAERPTSDTLKWGVPSG